MASHHPSSPDPLERSPTPTDSVPPTQIEAVRRFNRFYTGQIGLLEESLLESPFTLTEGRILFEVAHQVETTATDLAGRLRLDRGYLSRILASFHERGLLDRRTSEEDGRVQLLTLTPLGKKAFEEINAASEREIRELLHGVPVAQRARLVDAMHTIRSILQDPDEHCPSFLVRTHLPGDLGWVVHRHGVLYHREYAWDERFEALVAEIVADFARERDPARECCWIAERDGVRVGSVFLVRHPRREGVARLRLLLVEPDARGMGIGRRLVEECTRFARDAGYHTITLWTNSVLHAARRLYEREGYRLVEEDPHHSFGHDLVGQNWELTLA
jgi:DNA-binding MarR family transcriptional regulator/GNAT superfamily N-acetyltransferase